MSRAGTIVFKATGAGSPSAGSSITSQSPRMADVCCHEERSRLWIDREHRQERVGSDRRQRGAAERCRFVGVWKTRPAAGAGAAISASLGDCGRRRLRRGGSIGRRCRQGTELLTGPNALAEVAAASEVDVVLAAIVGSAGLRSTWAALEAKKTVALANKETLVMAGGLVNRLAAERGGDDSAGRQRTQCDFSSAASGPA